MFALITALHIEATKCEGKHIDQKYYFGYLREIKAAYRDDDERSARLIRLWWRRAPAVRDQVAISQKPWTGACASVHVEEEAETHIRGPWKSRDRC